MRHVAADVSGRYSIVGLGVTKQGRHLGQAPRRLRGDALDLALADAGVRRDAVDGYIGCSSDLFDDVRHLGLAPKFAWNMQTGGATPAWSIINAMGTIATGQAEVVVCAYAAAPTAGMLRRADGSVGGYGNFGYGYGPLYGFIGAAGAHALHARRHMERYGTTSQHMGAVAVVQRAHAAVRPGTLGFEQPITIEDHQTSRVIVDPLRLLDCTRDTDGGVVVVVTSTERARDLPGRHVLILGAGAGHQLRNWWTGEVFDLHDDVEPAARTAFGQAGLTVGDVDVAELYDPFTISVIMQLEAYGFCGPGDGGPFVASGATSVGGTIPTNTGGGQLSGFYATGFTAIVEGLRQLRGDGAATQVEGAEVALISGHGGHGGIQNTSTHATLILGVDR
jgi:acetyl-CoA acetyltransferase